MKLTKEMLEKASKTTEKAYNPLNSVVIPSGVLNRFVSENEKLEDKYWENQWLIGELEEIRACVPETAS